MKQFNTIALFACLLVTGLFSCQKELHFPEAPPVSEFTVEMDGKTYYLDIKQQTVQLENKAHVQILAESPDLYVSLNVTADAHQNGLGNYNLTCCSNVVYDRTTGVQKRWKVDQRGTVHSGSLNITRMDDKGYAGTYTIVGSNAETGSEIEKEFKGTFTVVY